MFKSMAFDSAKISTPELIWLIGVTVSGLRKVLKDEYSRYLESFEVWHVQFGGEVNGICDHCSLIETIDRVPALAELRSIPSIASAHDSGGRKPLTAEELQLVKLQVCLNRPASATGDQVCGWADDNGKERLQGKGVRWEVEKDKAIYLGGLGIESSSNEHLSRLRLIQVPALRSRHGTSAKSRFMLEVFVGLSAEEVQERVKAYSLVKRRLEASADSNTLVHVLDYGIAWANSTDGGAGAAVMAWPHTPARAPVMAWFVLEYVDGRDLTATASWEYRAKMYVSPIAATDTPRGVPSNQNEAGDSDEQLALELGRSSEEEQLANPMPACRKLAEHKVIEVGIAVLKALVLLHERKLLHGQVIGHTSPIYNWVYTHPPCSSR
jgi:hypothetical protein